MTRSPRSGGSGSGPPRRRGRSMGAGRPPSSPPAQGLRPRFPDGEWARKPPDAAGLLRQVHLLPVVHSDAEEVAAGVQDLHQGEEPVLVELVVEAEPRRAEEQVDGGERP